MIKFYIYGLIIYGISVIGLSEASIALTYADCGYTRYICCEWNGKDQPWTGPEWVALTPGKGCIGAGKETVTSNKCTLDSIVFGKMPVYQKSILEMCVLKPLT